jgi:hypothetical protein
MPAEQQFGSEPSAAAVLASLRALVTTQAAMHAAWQDFATAFLDPEAEAFIAARLSTVEGGGDDSGPPPKKRKKAGGAGEGAAATAPPADKTCDHCGAAVPQVALAVATMDGTTISVTVPERGCVREVKREVAKVLLRFDRGCRLSFSSGLLSAAGTWPARRVDGSVRPRH